MKFLYIALAIFGFLALSTRAEHYAVLVAGSNYFYNYRHQADIFHAWQALVAHGVPKANIITLAYDDIAKDPENPFPGQVFNKPTKGPGKDVYKGVKIDYSGDDVNSTNFLNILKGDSKATGGKKVLNSTKDDNVFIYFADHGATGLIAFPNDYLYANDFMAALTYMHDKKMYKEMVIYIEACEAGSMFDSILPKNISIYATTAANPDESSWGTYCDPDDMVNGTEIGSCLGDLYSVNFLENLDKFKPEAETLLKQYQAVKKETNLSHVMQYGNLAIDKEVIGDFEGNSTTFEPVPEGEDEFPAGRSNVNSRINKLAYLHRRNKKYQSVASKSALHEEIDSIRRFDGIFSGMKNLFELRTTASVGHIDFDCLKMRVEMYEVMCGKFTDYGLKYVKYIHATCSQEVDIYDYEAALINFCF
jgi:legumain